MKVGSLFTGNGGSSRGIRVFNDVANPVTASGGHHGHSSPRGDGSDNLVVAPCLTGVENSGIRAETAGALIIANTVRSSHNPGATDAIVFDRAQITSSTNRSQPEPGKPVPTLHGDPAMVAYTDRVAGTVGARDFKGAGSYRDGGIQNCAMVHGRVRRLMPVEYARLQGFPDDWNDWIADSARYKQFGNAVAVPVAEWIGRRIMALLR